MPVLVKSHMNHALILLSLYISQPTIGLLMSRSTSLFRNRGFNVDGNHISGRDSQRLYLDLRYILLHSHLIMQLHFTFTILYSAIELFRYFGHHFVHTWFGRNFCIFSCSDILDDDSTEFLEALKRQMEGSNILNASPREVSISHSYRCLRRSFLNLKSWVDFVKDISLPDIINSHDRLISSLSSGDESYQRIFC